MKVVNFFEDLPEEGVVEVIEKIAEFAQGAVRIERIVSRGQASDEDFWYEQEEHEWVMLIRGQARLMIESREEAFEMKAGDYIELPAKLRHRVESVSQDAFWLAVCVNERQV